MLFELFLSLRYLKAKRKRTFISVISFISIAGVMVGVMALIVVLSVMNGFRANFMSKILGVNPQIWVESYSRSFRDYNSRLKEIRAIKGVTAAAPAIYSQVLISTGLTTGALLRGIDPENTGEVLNIKPMIKDGTLSSLNTRPDGFPAIIVGSELAKQIGVVPGDIVKVTSPEGKLTPLGRTPSSSKFKVTGLFTSGMNDIDSSLVFVSLKEAQSLLGMENRITHIEVRLKDPYKSGIISKEIRDRLGDSFGTQDWQQTNKSLLGALQMEKFTMFAILIMIVLVGALNIISSLVMTVMEKSKGIAILRTMGATKKSIMTVFMIQGFFVGVIGTITGLFSGLGICYLLSKYKFIKIPSDIYNLSRLPVRVDSSDVIVVVIAALIISFLATIYPSWHASRLNPVETLRYE